MLHPFLYFYKSIALFHLFVNFPSKLFYSLHKYKETFLRKDRKFLPLIHTQNVETVLRMQSRRESADFQLQDLIKISGFPILFA